MAWNDMKSDQMKSDVITILLIVGKERYDDEGEEKKNRYEGRGRRGEEMTETFLKGNKWGIKTGEREKWHEKKKRKVDKSIWKPRKKIILIRMKWNLFVNLFDKKKKLDAFKKSEIWPSNKYYFENYNFL